MPPLTSLLGWCFYMHVTEAKVHAWINVDRAMDKTVPALLGYSSSLPDHSRYAD